MGTALNLIWLKGTKRVRKGGRGKERVRGRGREREEGSERKGGREGEGGKGGRKRSKQKGKAKYTCTHTAPYYCYYLISHKKLLCHIMYCMILTLFT